MEYNRLEIGPYNLHVIQTDKFKKNVISVSFKEKFNEKNITIRTLLSMMLVRSTMKYPDERSMSIASEELYNITFNNLNTIYGNYMMMEIDLTFLDTKYTSDELDKESVAFLQEIIFNPFVKNKKFDEKTFDLVKEELKQYIISLTEVPSRYATLKLHQSIDKKEPYAYLADGNLEDLEKITPSSLYKYYLNVLKNNNLDIFVIGNDSKNIAEIIKDTFEIKTIKAPIKNYAIVHKKIRKKIKTVKEKFDINQSILKIGIKLDNLTEFESKYVINIYNYILSGGPDSKLFKNVREKHSLCYTISSNLSKVFGLMIISSGIDGKNFDKAVSLIKKELKNMEKGKFSEEDINSAKTIYTSSVTSLKDSPEHLISIYKGKEYLNLDSLEVRTEEVKKVTKEMIVELAKKIKIDTIFLLEGESDE